MDVNFIFIELYLYRKVNITLKFSMVTWLKFMYIISIIYHFKAKFKLISWMTLVFKFGSTIYPYFEIDFRIKSIKMLNKLKCIYIISIIYNFKANFMLIVFIIIFFIFESPLNPYNGIYSGIKSLKLVNPLKWMYLLSIMCNFKSNFMIFFCIWVTP